MKSHWATVESPWNHHEITMKSPWRTTSPRMTGPGGQVSGTKPNMPWWHRWKEPKFHGIGLVWLGKSTPETMGFYHQISRAFRWKFSHHPILWSWLCQSAWWFQYLPLWKMMEWKSVGMMTFPTEWKNKTCSKPPTSNGIGTGRNAGWMGLIHQP